MSGNIYFVVLGAFIVGAVLAFRGGRLWLGILLAALAGWTYYSHKTGTNFQDLKHELNEAVDESAKKKYETGIRSRAFESNASVVK